MSDDKRKDKPRGQLLTMDEVLEIVRVSPRTLEGLVRDGWFPRPCFVSENRRFWREADVLGYIDNLPDNGRYYKRAQPSATRRKRVHPGAKPRKRR